MELSTSLPKLVSLGKAKRYQKETANSKQVEVAKPLKTA